MHPSNPSLDTLRAYHPGERFFAPMFDQDLPFDASIGEFDMGHVYLKEPEEDQFEIIRILYASTTSDRMSILAARREGRIHVELVDEYGNESVGEAVGWFDSVPTQGEIWDWLLSIRTPYDEVYVIPPVIPTLTRTEAERFIVFSSVVYPGLDALDQAHLKTMLP